MDQIDTPLSLFHLLIFGNMNFCLRHHNNMLASQKL